MPHQNDVRSLSEWVAKYFKKRLSSERLFKYPTTNVCRKDFFAGLMKHKSARAILCYQEI